MPRLYAGERRGPGERRGGAGSRMPRDMDVRSCGKVGEKNGYKGGGEEEPAIYTSGRGEGGCGIMGLDTWYAPVGGGIQLKEWIRDRWGEEVCVRHDYLSGTGEDERGITGLE